MPDLITTPVAPESANVTSEISLTGNFALPSGQYLYSTTLPRTFGGWGDSNYVFTNAGTIWNDPASDSRILQIGNWGRIDNSGTIVAHSSAGVAHTIYVSSYLGRLTNSGGIYALSDSAGAIAIEHWGGGTPIENSGTIAARGATYAQAIYAPNGSEIVNGATGAILVEGANAIGIIYLRGHFQVQGQAPTAVDILNYGRIEARSTNADNASIAIYVASSGGESMVIENHGVIRADVAIVTNPYRFSPPQHASETITNHSDALIDGAILLDLGDDSLVNQGQIIGYVDMGEGDDLFDNRLGQHVGNAELGWGNDTYWGGSGRDAATGDRGNDVMAGGGGEDLLLGGWGDDVLEGGTGNDGLYGEGGNDRIVASGGDYVDAGSGNDRVQLTDYRFAKVDGGEGGDILVLPADSRILDLSTVLASGRVTGFEHLTLSASGRLVVRAADVLALTNGNTLAISGAAGATVDLAGSWSVGLSQAIGSTVYVTYQAGDSTLLIAQTLTVNVGSAPAGVGLDTIADGAAAPVPGSTPDADLTSNTVQSSGTSLHSDLEINQAEIWTSTGGSAVIVADDPFVSLTNRGTISSGGTNGAVAVSGYNLAGLLNYGSINATSSGAGTAGGVWFGSGIWDFLNVGSIRAESALGDAVGYATWGRPGENRGTITAVSGGQSATGVNAENAGTFINSGTISATAVSEAYGIRSSDHQFTLFNSGSIVAHATGSSASGIGVDLYYGMFFQRIVNTGSITGEIAIRTFGTTNGNNLWLDNSGTINGRIELGGDMNGFADDRQDVIVNRGTINGTVLLGGGGDVFDGSQGNQNGVVSGEDGSDLIIGGSGRDALDGGAGSDILFGRGGDTLTGGSEADIFVFGRYVPGQANEVITDFVSGLDRIDLRAASPSSVLINGSTISAVTSTGTLTIQVNQSVAYSDIVTDTSTSILFMGGGALGGPVGTNFFLGPLVPLQVGSAGNDRLGAAVMYGGDGNDTYVVDAESDLVIENANGGYDVVEIVPGQFIFYFTLPDFVEGLFGGSGFGNSLGNVMTGGAGGDWLDGRDGADTLNGAAGNDTITGGNGSDVLTGGLGNDTFIDTVAGLNGDWIMDFGPGDRIRLTDADPDNFSFSLSGNVLSFTGGSITLGSVPTLPIAFARGISGVDLVIVQPEARNDFNGDGRSDLAFRNGDGTVTNWLATIDGTFVNNDANALQAQNPGATLIGIGDFNGGFHDDLLWHGNDGSLTMWLANTKGGWPPNTDDPYAGAGVQPPTRISIGQLSTDWKVAGIGDFDGDGREDIIWRNQTGAISEWLSQPNTQFAWNPHAAYQLSLDWQVAGVGDFNGDGRDDIMWRHSSGVMSEWLGQAGGTFAWNSKAAYQLPSNWKAVGTDDFNGDGRDDILWRNETGVMSEWLANADGTFGWNPNAAYQLPTNWTAVSTGDFNGDGRADILWTNENGDLSQWLGHAGGTFAWNPNLVARIPVGWEAQSDTLI